MRIVVLCINCGINAQKSVIMARYKHEYVYIYVSDNHPRQPKTLPTITSQTIGKNEASNENVQSADFPDIAEIASREYCS